MLAQLCCKRKDVYVAHILVKDIFCCLNSSGIVSQRSALVFIQEHFIKFLMKV